MLIILGFMLVLAGCASEPHANRTPSSEQSCSDVPVVATADDSSQKAYFQKILQQGDAVPLKILIHLWYPERERKVENSYFLNCRDENGHLTRDNQGGIPEECRPDVLYSWQWKERADAMPAKFPDGAAWRGDANPFIDRSGGGFPGISSTISPVSTYSYGPTPVRYKLRPGTLFEPTFSPAPDRIGYPLRAKLQDFMIADETAIESYSMGTPEIYDEIVKDIRQISSNSSALDYSGESQGYLGMDRVYHAGVAERGPQDEAALKSRLLGLIRVILNGEGRVYFRKGVCRSKIGLHPFMRHFRLCNPRAFEPVG